MRIALSIAGSDPTGGAGLQADLQVFRAFGVHGAAAPSALTVQEPARVRQVLPVFPSVMLEQLRCLFSALRPDAIKLGMLGSDEVLRAVTLALEGFGAARPPVVIDPVLFASDGTALLERRAWPGLRALFRDAALVTPNLPEAAALSGREAGALNSKRAVEETARALLKSGAQAILIKGGHATEDADDCLAQKTGGDGDGSARDGGDRDGGRGDGGDRDGDGGRGDGDGVKISWLRGERIPGARVHGTGCALAAAVTAGLGPR